jgi:hypothetical protein
MDKENVVYVRNVILTLRKEIQLFMTTWKVLDGIG